MASSWLKKYSYFVNYYRAKGSDKSSYFDGYDFANKGEYKTQYPTLARTINIGGKGFYGSIREVKFWSIY